jgi:hypothetical protein
MDGKITFDFLRQFYLRLGAVTALPGADRLTIGAGRRTVVFNTLRDWP